MQSGKIKISVFETSRRGGRFHTVPHDLIAKHNEPDPSEATIQVQSDQRKQRITGFGGSFTDASAFLVHQMSPSQRQRIMEAYFHEDGACYSLTRTHMNSCDFSRFQYSYAPVEGDVDLKHFSIDPDREFLIPMMQAAQEISKDGFDIIASPWTAPPWMKDNNAWVGGHLRPEMQPTWAQFFVKYAQAYAEPRAFRFGALRSKMSRMEMETIGRACSTLRSR